MQVKRPGWSVSRLSRDSGIARSTLHRWLAGDASLTTHSVRRIAQTLGVDLAEAMLAAGAALGPPKVDDDPEMRVVIESDLADAKKAAIIAHIRARRARDLEETKTLIEIARQPEDT